MPITVQAPWVAELRGVTLPDVGVSILEGNQVLASHRGSLLFAHFGLSGPVILDLSRVVSGHPRPGTLTLELDLLPAQREPALDEWLRTEIAAAGKKQLAALLASLLPRRLADAVVVQAGLAADRKAAALSRPDRTG